ncbi:probable glycosyltransferase At5g03795 [Corylus avellana]|uniref:probable glycosyltransferase At5g03795 n=1 Tax=Corylus avellana TaxID=13451 RepID=UPI002869ED36|nr:probable glycosyltransferase At5g03795 [Corylus avellana]
MRHSSNPFCCSSSSSFLVLLLVIIPFFLLLFGFFSFSSPPFSKQITSGLLEAAAAAAPLSAPFTSYSQHNEGSEAPTSAFNISAEAPAPLGSAKPREASPPLIHEGFNEGFETSKGSSRLKRIEASLGKARFYIREAGEVRNFTTTSEDPEEYVPQGPIYKNPNAFHRSYVEMERLMKVYVYEEGEAPLFHDGPCKSIYSTEGKFISEMEKGGIYRTRNPEDALVFFLPFSVVSMVHHLYEPDSYDVHPIRRVVVDYIDAIARRHPFWNRSLGADHFMLSCHDWGPRVSSFVPHLFHRSIRVLCNANTSEGFNPSKDASLPEINLLTGKTTGLVGGLSPSRRSVLAFFAGRLHGHIRYLLLEQWKNKDQDVQVYDQLPPKVSYYSMLRKSRFCLCPSGYEVASPRVVEAIYAECVPVLISAGYVPPFSDVLNWKAFSVQVDVKDIPNIKTILMGISQRQYLRLYRRVKQVQRHFLVNAPPKRFDVFHMTLHSIWLRRLNIQIQDQ